METFTTDIPCFNRNGQTFVYNPYSPGKIQVVPDGIETIPVTTLGKMQERIICAAVYRDGITYIGYRHPDAIKKAVECGCAFPIRQSEQGFYTTEKRYVTREEAFEIAGWNGQILPGTEGLTEGGILYSENLY